MLEQHLKVLHDARGEEAEGQGQLYTFHMRQN